MINLNVLAQSACVAPLSRQFMDVTTYVEVLHYLPWGIDSATVGSVSHCAIVEVVVVG